MLIGLLIFVVVLLACVSVTLGVLLRRAVTRLSMYEEHMHDIYSTVKSFNDFIKFVYEKQLFFDSPHLNQMFANWSYIELTFDRILEELDIIFDGGVISFDDEELVNVIQRQQ